MAEADRPDTSPVPAHGGPFVPSGFIPPEPPRTSTFWLEPLRPEHNEADFAAWMSSIEHIHATPGFPDGDWPHTMPIEENLADLHMHADHFARGIGFTYTVRSTADDDVIGCVYIYPSKDAEIDVHVTSWVRASHAEYDTDLWQSVNAWVVDAWPFGPDRIDYAPRSRNAEAE
jgi:hypothetical protein